MMEAFIAGKTGKKRYRYIAVINNNTDGHLPPITKTIQDEPDTQDTAGEATTSS